jgi:hypothetical protein
MKLSTLVLAAALVLPVVGTVQAADAVDPRIAGSREVVKAFGGQLLGDLQTAMKSGGPVEAIKVCNVSAPAIARTQAEQRGWKVGRTSLKVRNPNNAPDAWERKMLEDFVARRAQGEDPAGMEVAETVVTDGKPEFRYMKAIAIPAGAPCVTCHGKTIEPTVAAAIHELYPQDQATGFDTGDIRGAFTIRQPVP